MPNTLMPCLGCTKPLDPTAQACPQCGRPNPTGKPRSSLRKTIAKGIGTVLLAMIIIPFVAGSSSRSSSTSSPSPQEPTIEIRADALYAAYQDNEVAADARFKGRPIAVTGVIQSIDKDVFGKASVSLSVPHSFLGVRARIDKSSTNSLVGLHKGDIATFKCIGGIMVAGTPHLSDCWF